MYLLKDWCCCFSLNLSIKSFWESLPSDVTGQKETWIWGFVSSSWNGKTDVLFSQRISQTQSNHTIIRIQFFISRCNVLYTILGQAEDHWTKNNGILSQWSFYTFKSFIQRIINLPNVCAFLKTFFLLVIEICTIVHGSVTVNTFVRMIQINTILLSTSHCVVMNNPFTSCFLHFTLAVIWHCKCR